MTIRTEGLWAGSQESHDTWAKLDAAVEEKLLAYNPNGGEDEEDEDKPYLLEKQGGVAVINVKGPLTSRDSWVNKYLGITSYGAIREALIYAAEDPETTHILLDVDSPGGHVKGCMDTGNLIKLVGKIKPVTAFAELAASAGYWLASSAGELLATESADIGSIGVIAVHMERSKQLKAEGVGVTVVRGGRFKALANGVETLSEEGKKQLQSQVDAAYELFVQHVADARNVPYAYADENMAQGREFFGKQALEAGLVDGITTYDDLMQKLIKKSVDAINNSDNNRGNIMQGGNMKRALSPEQILAAQAEGAVIAADPDVGAPAPAAAPAVTPEAVSAAPVIEASAAAVSAESPVIAMLQGQLKEANASLMQANVDLSKLTAQLDSIKASHDGLVAIAAKSVTNMRVALNLATVDASAMTAESLLAEHLGLTAQFQASFKAGGVAAVSAGEAVKVTSPNADASHQARIAATTLK